jgi:hypothetical protein
MASTYVTKLYISWHTTYMYWQCTYLGFGLLEAPREYVLHGPLLAIYWLRLCPHFGPCAVRSHACLEDAVYSFNDSSSYSISPNVFSLWVASHQCKAIFHYSTWQRHTSLLYITFIRTFTTSYYTSHSYVHSHLHSFISSALLGRLAALDSLCPIQAFNDKWGPFDWYHFRPLLNSLDYVFNPHWKW